jgi:asparagine synthase (glutamine-hydrolysing)
MARRRYRRALGLLISIAPEILGDWPRLSGYWKHRARYTRAGGIDGDLRLPPPEPLELGADPHRPLWERQVRDVMQISLPTLLRYEDRSSMAHGVESRLPFLDYPLVEFALALGTSMKLRSGLGKWIVREYARGRIPESIRASRFKRGFDVEQDQWIDRGLGAAIRDALNERRAGIREFVDRDARFERMFSDARLKSSPSAFAEATTLIWLGNLATD